MIRALLAILFHIPLNTAYSLSSLTLPLPKNTPSNANLTAPINRIVCGHAPDYRPLSDFSTCIPSLFSLYATPLIHTVTIWDPGDFRQWGPGTDFGGCYILVDGGVHSDVFAVESLLGPAILALNKCFVGEVMGSNILAKTKVGPGNDWWLSVILERKAIAGNDSIS